MEGFLTQHRERPRSPGFVNAALSLAVLVAIGSIALTFRQPPPPTIAEFAPQAVQQITTEDEERAFTQGSGAGLPTPPSPDDLAGGAARRAEAIDVPRVRDCLGDPPQQIEDPQSPPCVPYWAGNNGGSTSRGVTQDEIGVSWFNDQLPDQVVGDLTAFFNRRFEFYGRKLVMRKLPNYGGYSGNGSGAQQSAISAATHAIEEHNSFAIMSLGLHYQEEFARRGIMYMDTGPWVPDSYRANSRPYLWQYTTGADHIMRHYGSWMCARLQGRPASHAQDALLIGRNRRFGLIFMRFDSYDLTQQGLVSSLGACGGGFAKQIGPELAMSRGTGDFEGWAENVVLQMKSDNVTSLVCMCEVNDILRLTTAATNQAYFPEWLMSSYLNAGDINLIPKALTTDPHAGAMFGISHRPKWVTPDQTPSVWATTEVDPAYNWWSKGIAPSTANQAGEVTNRFVLGTFFYRTMLMLASGIQMAGPNLTPWSFESALQRTQFPNHDHVTKPGRVGFSGDYSMVDDAAEIWWSDAGIDPQDGSSGAYCYVNGGTRHRADWPTEGDPFFSGGCDSGA